MTQVHYAGRLLPCISQPQDDRRRIKFHLTIPNPLDIHTDFGGQERHLSIILMLAPIQFIIAGQVQKNKYAVPYCQQQDEDVLISYPFISHLQEQRPESPRRTVTATYGRKKKGGLEEGNGAIVIPNLNSVTSKQLANQLDSVHSSNYTRRRRLLREGEGAKT